MAISWRVSSDPDPRSRFEMTWRETDGPPVDPPKRKGFGSQVLEDAARGNLRGEVSLDFAPSGLVWTFSCPSSACLASGSAASNDKASEDTFDRHARAPATLSPKRVLIVEDEALVAAGLATSLEKAGHDVIGPANTVDEALALLDAEGCEVAVLDVNLGRETSERVTQTLHQRSIPYVGLTGYNRDQVPESFAGVPLLTKPVRIDALLEALAACRAPSRQG